MVGRRKITRKSLLVSLRRVASVWIALKDAFKNFMPSGKAGSNQNSRRLPVALQRALVDTNYPVVNTITKKLSNLDRQSYENLHSLKTSGKDHEFSPRAWAYFSCRRDCFLDHQTSLTRHPVVGDFH